MTKKSKSSSTPSQTAKAVNEDGIFIPNDDLKIMIDRLQWILMPEVFYDPDPQKSANDALNRCRLRARDLLFQIVSKLPAGHAFANEIDLALVESKTLPFSIGISRAGPGELSRIEKSPKQPDLLREVSELLEGHIYLDPNS